MKKLLVALGAFAFALSTQAAQLNWSSAAFINDGSADSDWISGGQAYLVMVTDTDNFAVGDDLSVTGGTIVDSAAIQEGMVYGTWNTDTLTGGQSYNFAVISTTDGTSGSSMPTTGTYSVDKNGGNAGSFYTVTWNADTGATINPDWTSFEGTAMTTPVSGTTPGPIVPEPTTYALVGLAAAALALRKRFRK